MVQACSANFNAGRRSVTSLPPGAAFPAWFQGILRVEPSAKSRSGGLPGYRRRRNQHHRSPGTPSPASPGGRPPNDVPGPGRRRGRSGGPTFGVHGSLGVKPPNRGRATFYARTRQLTSQAWEGIRMSHTMTALRYAARSTAYTTPRLLGVVGLVAGIVLTVLGAPAPSAQAAPSRDGLHRPHHAVRHHHGARHHPSVPHHRHHAALGSAAGRVAH